MKRIFIILLVVALASVLLPLNTVSATPDRPVTPPQLKHIILIHYAQPDVLPAKPGKPPAPDPIYTDYTLLGPKWAGTVSYIIDPDSAPVGVTTEVSKAFEAWDGATSFELFNNSYVVDPNANPSTSSPDSKNVVCWRLLAGYPKAIAITSIWYFDNTGDGMSSDDQMQDCDVIFNLKFKWGIDPDGTGPLQLPKGYYDICNIATHEAGHVVGLDDLYAPVDREMTMYGYSAAKETKKTNLEIGDKNGCLELYGP